MSLRDDPLCLACGDPLEELLDEQRRPLYLCLVCQAEYEYESWLHKRRVTKTFHASSRYL